MIVPNSKPQLKKAEALKLLEAFDLTKYPVKLLGIRGYYKQTMGNPVSNDRGIYDDAIFIITDTVFMPFNANTDPSRTAKGMAVLKPGGPYLYKVGLHGVSGPNPYEALRQHGRITVIRDGKGEETDTERNPFYIDIHRGGYNVTSSLGCQTITPQQWPDFIANVKQLMKAAKQDIIPYCLVAY